MATSFSLRVAIADDDPWMRKMLQQMVRKLGHEIVAVAENGESLIERCAAMEPDVVLTDNLMPDMSGANAAAIIYDSRPTQIILLSAYCDRELVLDAEQKHVLMYLVKPISQAHLEAALARCQELQASEREFRESSTIESTEAAYRRGGELLASGGSPIRYQPGRPR